MRIVRNCKDCMYSSCSSETVICSVFGMRVDGAIRKCSVYIPKTQKEVKDEKEKR